MGFNHGDMSEEEFVRMFNNGVFGQAAEMLKIEEAKNHLRRLLLALDVDLTRRSKDRVIADLKYLFQAVESYQNLMAQDVCAEVRNLLSGLLVALTTSDVVLKGSHMARIESWHDAKPPFILHLEALRQMVFSS